MDRGRARRDFRLDLGGQWRSGPVREDQQWRLVELHAPGERVVPSGRLRVRGSFCSTGLVALGRSFPATAAYSQHSVISADTQAFRAQWSRAAARSRRANNSSGSEI